MRIMLAVKRNWVTSLYGGKNVIISRSHRSSSHKFARATGNICFKIRTEQISPTSPVQIFRHIKLRTGCEISSTEHNSDERFWRQSEAEPYLGLPRLYPEGRQRVRLGQSLPLAVLVEAGVEAGRRRGHHVDSIWSSSNTENLDTVPEVPGSRRLLEHSLQSAVKWIYPTLNLNIFQNWNIFYLLVVERVGGLPEWHPGCSVHCSRPRVLQRGEF